MARRLQTDPVGPELPQPLRVEAGQRHPQPPPRLQEAQHLGQRRRRGMDMLEHVTEGDVVEAVGCERGAGQGPLLDGEALRPCRLHRLGVGLEPGDVIAAVPRHLQEVAIAAPHVQQVPGTGRRGGQVADEGPLPGLVQRAHQRGRQPRWSRMGKPVAVAAVELTIGQPALQGPTAGRQAFRVPGPVGVVAGIGPSDGFRIRAGIEIGAIAATAPVQGPAPRRDAEHPVGQVVEHHRARRASAHRAVTEMFPHDFAVGRRF